MVAFLFLVSKFIGYLMVECYMTELLLFIDD